MRSLAGLALMLPLSLAVAQDVPTPALPNLLEGKWINNAGGRVFTGRIAFQIEGRAPDGSITGRWTFEGVRCKGSELAATAQYDGAQLIVRSRIDDGAVCGLQTATFRRTDRTGSHALFEGRLGGDGKAVLGNDVDAFLDPK